MIRNRKNSFNIPHSSFLIPHLRRKERKEK